MPATARRRQIGTERSFTPLPVEHPRPTAQRIAMSRLAILATLLFWASYVVTTVLREFIEHGGHNFRFHMEAASYVVVVTMLTFSALMYLLARHGALLRFRDHHRATRVELDEHFTDTEPPMTVLVPSYAEEPEVVAQTLWSAALQEYPELSVVLLIDDAPHPTEDELRQRLERTRAVPAAIQAQLEVPRARMAEALDAFEQELGEWQQTAKRQAARYRSTSVLPVPSEYVTEEQVAVLAGHYYWASRWLTSLAEAQRNEDHVDTFFTDQVLGGLARDLRTVAEALRLAVEAGELPRAHRMRQLYRRLERIFTARLSSFERKHYVSLSHEANKAMNLNAYLGLLDGAYRLVQRPCGRVLEKIGSAESEEAGEADLVVPAADFVLTLDADSLLLPEYCLRLVHLMQSPGNERIAVAQTPYSSFRGAGSRIERLAGATTDIQHLLHQGMTHFGATFWVGANAVIRTEALRDIAETSWEDGFEVTRFVQDRTVIEDTESSIDLGTHGWSLTNYPERLSYSATPPDFGSLVVQRRRWANGGLLILPKYWRQLQARRRAGEQIRAGEVLLRVNYMASIAWASVGLLFLLAYPYDSRLLSPLIIAAAVPYFLTMGADLRQTGYKFSDIFRIYGFNLILLPVNLAGVLKSLQQGMTGQKIPFARTPKVKNRTASPWLYVLIPALIVVFSIFTFWRDFSQQNWGNAIYASFNAFWASWAIIAYIGLRASVVDFVLGLWQMLHTTRPRRRDRQAAAQSTESKDRLETAPELDWRLVLEEGRVAYREASQRPLSPSVRRHRPAADPALASIGSAGPARHTRIRTDEKELAA
ncbi:glycosyltransferase family 2 protein [Nesterenkonia flava]|uniref:Glycosyltransferase family 2 protein n=1 Tax=Nesterenkonia flava TaxID=469799 RepID=A0ABU1FWQ9_9MICC|nr:glycosyltransferase family 2 protein [Nesterenkonia flava]MDR5712556.1 glycosyltransferase family 2 protein [Nesterenkonia flava]